MARRVKSEAERAIDVAVGASIERLRKQQGMTQTQLAAQIGVTQAAVYQYESGDVACSLARLISIASALGVSLPALIQKMGLTYLTP